MAVPEIGKKKFIIIFPRVRYQNIPVYHRLANPNITIIVKISPTKYPHY